MTPSNETGPRRPAALLSTVFFPVVLVAVFAAAWAAARPSVPAGGGPTVGGAPTYEVRGRLVRADRPAGRAVIAHEAIPGLMPAMTMEFAVRPPASLGGLVPGTAVRFTLAVSDSVFWVERLRPDTDAPAVLPAARAVGASLAVGDRLPAFRLVGDDGRPVLRDDYAGRPLVLTFFYTGCPVAEFCPLLHSKIQALQAPAAAQSGSRVRFLSVSLDAEHDRPAALQAYARRYTGDGPSAWRFATGSPADVARLARAFSVLYAPAVDGTATLDHTLTTALVGPDGRVRRLWEGNGWTTEEVLAALADFDSPSAARAIRGTDGSHGS